MKRVLLVAVLLVYSVYMFARPVEQPRLAEQMLSFSGQHAALAPGAPDGYDVQSLTKVLARQVTTEDYWLYAPENLFQNPDIAAQLRPWLSANDAIIFPNNGETVFWITARDRRPTPGFSAPIRPAK